MEDVTQWISSLNQHSWAVTHQLNHNITPIPVFVHHYTNILDDHIFKTGESLGKWNSTIHLLLVTMRLPFCRSWKPPSIEEAFQKPEKPRRYLETKPGRIPWNSLPFVVPEPQISLDLFCLHFPLIWWEKCDTWCLWKKRKKKKKKSYLSVPVRQIIAPPVPLWTSSGDKGRV